jgi:hypothetical protein
MVVATETVIIVRLQMDGIHCWKDAAEKMPSMAFLANPHRHMFHISVEKLVKHDDRDVEFIKFKRDIIAYLRRQFGDDNGVLQLGSMSCEMLAKQLLGRFDLEMAQVEEDGENGARIMRREARWHPKDVEISNEEEK